MVDLLLPEVCLACGAGETSAAGLCRDCNVHLLSLVSLRYCPRCGATIGPNIPVREDGCRACPNPLPRFAAVVRLGPYTGPLRQVVRSLKYHHQGAPRRLLGRMLAEGLAALHGRQGFDFAVPVPMHWRRRLIRGYDHSRALAGAVAGELGVPVYRELIRMRHTPPQVHLPRSRRIENVRGAFSAPRLRHVEGANILLIDDVTTTGATANEAARALLKAAALRVTLAVVAKGEPPTAYAEYQANA